MKAILTKRVFIVLIFISLFCTGSYAQPVSSSDLINKAREYDGKTVIYQGEVIGDVMRRGDYAWINVHDGSNAIGIWTSTALIGDIAHKGSYTCRGDLVEVGGIANRTCRQHGGDLDIHAQYIKKIESGKVIIEKLNVQKRNLAIVLLGVLVAVWILMRLKHK